MNNVSVVWEKRSKIFTDSQKAVMEQSFPPKINNYIEMIHLSVIEKILNIRSEKCLDVGCGYGRIPSALTIKYPHMYVYGVDVSPTFVKLFNKKIGKRGKAYVADIRKLPFKDNFFDAIWVVVSFMYLDNSKAQRKGMKELFRVLKSGGKIVFIEPNKFGVDLVRLWGFIPFLYRKLFRKKKVETFGIAFPFNKIDLLVSEFGGEIVYKKGYPFMTLFLFPSIIIGKMLPFLITIPLFFIKRVDTYLSIARISYFISYIAVKGHNKS